MFFKHKEPETVDPELIRRAEVAKSFQKGGPQRK